MNRKIIIEMLNENTNVVNVIMDSLDETYNRLIFNAPKTYNLVKNSDSIMDFTPIELISYMKQNDIPETAYFVGKDNGYDGYNDFVLKWTEKMDATQKNKEDHVRNIFKSHYFRPISQKLTNMGYKRINFDSGKHRNFLNKYNISLQSNTFIHDFYKEKNLQAILEYFSNMFNIN